MSVSKNFFFLTMLSFSSASASTAGGIELPNLSRKGPPGWDQNWQLSYGITLEGETPSPDACYSSGQPGDGVEVTVQLSDILSVSLFSRSNVPERMASVNIWVCKDEECVLCGYAPEVGVQQWAETVCSNGPISGNKVRLQKPGEYLDFCEIKIMASRGIELPNLSRKGPPGWDQNWQLSYGITLEGETPSPDACYSSGQPGDAVEVTVQLSDISSVSLFSRNNVPERMALVQIYVCKDEQCFLCGYAPEVGVQQWAETVCNNGPISGDRVRLQKPGEYLDFCEVKIMAPQPVEIAVTARNGPPGWTAEFDLIHGVTLPGETPSPARCYSSKNENAKVLLSIPMSTVTSVSLFSRREAAERMEAVQVHVCVNGLCAFCGSAPLVGVQQWAKVPCNNGGVKGNQIMLQKPEKSLDFCEVKVMGTSDGCSTGCGDYNRFCPALTDPSFASSYQQLLSSDAVLANFGSNVPPTPISCDNDFYRVACPMSCNQCKSC